ncbi:MAG: transglutaminase-like domain-containing protein [Desulforhopalus sp.]
MTSFSYTKTFWFRLAVTMVWLVFLTLLVKRELFVVKVSPGEQQILEQAAREEYQGVYFQNQKIGYVINQYRPGEDETIFLDQKALMNLNVGHVTQRIELHLQAVLNSDATLENFSFDFTSPFYQMSADGKIVENRIDFTLTTGSNVIADSLPVTDRPIIPTARRGYLLGKGLERGQRIKVPWFDPMSLTAKDSVIEYQGRDRVRIGGRVHNLHRFNENFGGARVSLWLNDEGDVVKEESPAGFVFIKEPKFRALEMSETGEELLSSVAVKVKGDMPPLAGRKKMRYRLQLPDEVEFDLSGGRQRYDGDILTIEQEMVAGGGDAAAATCPALGDSLEASPYIQTNAARIDELAANVTAPDDTSLQRVRKLAAWVYSNLEKRPVLGIPDALTTLENLQGDCNEHAALFAALARNTGIPTRIAAGVMYNKDAFYYHAWNEVCLGGRWLTVDTTTKQFPADLGHIKFVQGELQEQVRIGALLGRLGIEPIADEENGER